MEMPNFVAAVVRWLRLGYPDGVPGTDYVPLFALLSRRLTSEEVDQVLNTIALDDRAHVERLDIQVLITRITNEMPREDDVERVRRKLVDAGWPLDA